MLSDMDRLHSYSPAETPIPSQILPCRFKRGRAGAFSSCYLVVSHFGKQTFGVMGEYQLHEAAGTDGR